MISIRKGEKKDLPAVLDLVKELAEYEKSLDQVNNNVSQMGIDGFGENSVFNTDNDEMVSQTTGNAVNSNNIGADMIWNPSAELFLGGGP